MKKGDLVWVYGSGGVPSQGATYLKKEKVGRGKRKQEAYRVLLQDGREDLVAPEMVVPLRANNPSSCRSGNPPFARATTRWGKDVSGFNFHPFDTVMKKGYKPSKGQILTEMFGVPVVWKKRKDPVTIDRTDIHTGKPVKKTISQKATGYFAIIDGQAVHIGRDLADAEDTLATVWERMKEKDLVPQGFDPSVAWPGDKILKKVEKLEKSAQTAAKKAQKETKEAEAARKKAERERKEAEKQRKAAEAAQKKAKKEAQEAKEAQRKAQEAEKAASKKPSATKKTSTKPKKKKEEEKPPPMSLEERMASFASAIAEQAKAKA